MGGVTAAACLRWSGAGAGAGWVGRAAGGWGGREGVGVQRDGPGAGAWDGGGRRSSLSSDAELK